jgi:hypothetical protein
MLEVVGYSSNAYPPNSLLWGMSKTLEDIMEHGGAGYVPLKVPARGMCMTCALGGAGYAGCESMGPGR